MASFNTISIIITEIRTPFFKFYKAISINLPSNVQFRVFRYSLSKCITFVIVELYAIDIE